MSATTVQVRLCTSSDELHCHYQGEIYHQRAYIELGLKDGILLASYDGEIGGGRPASVYHGIDRRYYLPVEEHTPVLLTGDAANALLEKLTPLAQRILDGGVVEWDGNNWVGRLQSEDAQAAEEELKELIGQIESHDEGALSVWDMDSIGDAWDANEAGITAQTTDKELDEIGARLLAEFREGMGEPEAVIHGLDDHLRRLRAELADEQD